MTPRPSDPPSLEAVAAPCRLLVQDGEIAPHGFQRRRRAAEPDQLRVAPVPLRPPPQNRLGQKTLPPGGHQTKHVEVLRMDCPQAHVLSGPSIPTFCAAHSTCNVHPTSGPS